MWVIVFHQFDLVDPAFVAEGFCDLPVGRRKRDRLLDAAIFAWLDDIAGFKVAFTTAVVQLVELGTQHGGQITITGLYVGPNDEWQHFERAYVTFFTVLGGCDLPTYPQPVDN